MEKLSSDKVINLAGGPENGRARDKGLGKIINLTGRPKNDRGLDARSGKGNQEIQEAK